MANTLVLLERVTVGAAGAASITFSNIPQTGYNDLVIKVSTRTAAATTYTAINLLINGSSSSFTNKVVEGYDSAVGSYSNTGVYGYSNGGSTTSSTFCNIEYYFPNAFSSNYKSFSVDSVTEGNSTTGLPMDLYAGLWSNTAAISSLTFSVSGTTFVQYSTFSLYGVSNVNTTPLVAPKATGGDIIQTDGTYWYHAFINSGTFTPATSLQADVLQIAGGGGGANYRGGGGGAGGLVYNASTSLINGTSYTCTIGAGGAGGAASSSALNPGVVGTNSSFGSLTAAAGGGYGAPGGYSGTGMTGGSGGSGGGGGAYENSTPGVGGSASPSGQGNAGGTGANNSAPDTRIGGGGGGASAAGNNGNAGGGTGGAGSSAYSSWGSATSTGQLVSSTYYYAGGGGGGGGFSTSGTGGNGGGGAGGYNANGTAGTVNTGGGAGGGGRNETNGTVYGGAQGGSGIVIVRYTV